MISPSNAERRSRPRIEARLPLRLKSKDRAKGAPGVEEIAESRDVSTNGIFLYTKSQIAEGADLEIVLMLPPELTAGAKSWVCCHARVVRVEKGAGAEFGVAAEINRMDVLPEISI